MHVCDLTGCLQSMRVERAELEAFRHHDECAFYTDRNASLRLETLVENIEMICRARTDQQLKSIQSTLAEASAAALKKQLMPKLVHLRQSLPPLRGCVRLPAESKRLEWWNRTDNLCTH